MIKTLPFSIAEEDIENTILTALEAQFRATSVPLNPENYHLHKQTEYAMGTYYLAIAGRKVRQTTIPIKQIRL
jgi:hypothetical protein